jgi:protein-tyrosine phosphatase/membrane-associated phospholipid phosphatase
VDRLEARRCPLWQSAILTILFLGPLFFLVYGFCNWYASRLVHVPSYYYEWERRIPFVPALIVPYFSIDLFYAGAVFLCRDRRELNRHACRIVAAIVLSALGFVLFPLRFAFARPAVDGIYGYFFSLLDRFDRPFNQAPSLHVSLLMILWIRYADRTVGRWRWLLHAWFALIGLSIVFVYQHHVIDIWSGFVVGVVCLYAIPESPRQWCGFALTFDPQRRRLGLLYFAAALLLAGLAAALQSWAWLLLWPAVSLSLVAIAYWLAGPSVFQKLDGRQSWPARALLAPYLLGAWLSYRFHTRGRPASQEAAPGLFFGRLPRREESHQWATAAVLDLTAEFSAGRGKRPFAYLNVPVLDLTVPEPAALRAALDFIEQQISSRPVFVHCALGLSRSAAVVAAWLLRTRRVDEAVDALQNLKNIRPGVTWSAAHVAAISEAANGVARK